MSNVRKKTDMVLKKTKKSNIFKNTCQFSLKKSENTPFNVTS